MLEDLFRVNETVYQLDTTDSSLHIKEPYDLQAPENDPLFLPTSLLGSVDPHALYLFRERLTRLETIERGTRLYVFQTALKEGNIAVPGFTLKLKKGHYPVGIVNSSEGEILAYGEGFIVASDHLLRATQINPPHAKYVLGLPISEVYRQLDEHEHRHPLAQHAFLKVR